MLCDTLIASTSLRIGYGRDYIDFQRKLVHAQKFVLGPDYAAAADGLVDNFPELEKIAPFIRIPFPLTWIEFAHGDRPQFITAPMSIPQIQGLPSRVGFLCEAKDPQHLGRFQATLHWTMRGPVYDFPPESSSMLAIDFDTEEPRPNLENYIETNVASYGINLALAIVNSGNTEAHNKISRQDWAGEIRYLMAVLGLFNARNVTETESVNLVKKNKIRLKKKELPLCEHTILKIRARHRPSLLGKPGAGTAQDVRSHFVMGHWKQRTSGLFWWNPHRRGSRTRGEVTHTYELTE